ncbi:MAG: xanthan lyase [Prevotellaceae bacterium]|nr:xanthan lyase [Prevotellaceae bacterium]
MQNIRYVSKYESKLLYRSWFFRIFALLAAAVLITFNIMGILTPGYNFWNLSTVPANIPYANMLILNTGQAIVAIFLASDFLKRDRKLDTSEIFYVRPLSNAEYVLGKIWGNIRIFVTLDLIMASLSVTLTAASPDVSVDWGAYIFYFLVICIPTLVYIIGLSVFMMLIFRSQAVTFVLLLGYIGATLFYLNDKYYYLFDYMTYYLPLMKSTIVGFPNIEEIIIHRSIYLFGGLACIFMTVPMLGRLPNSTKSSYPWVILSLCALMMCVNSGYRHIGRILRQDENRRLYTQINNKYVHSPKMTVERYDISVKQNRETFSSEVVMTGVALASSPVFTFCLNPGLAVTEVRESGTGGNEASGAVKYIRDRQILLVDFGREIHAGDTVALSVAYGGKIDNSFCYPDVPKEKLSAVNRTGLLSIDKQYSFQKSDYMMLTPETYWYPRPGTGYSDKSPDWQQTYFSRFTLHVTPMPGLIPVSQGEGIENADGSYSFAPEYPAQAISLVTGKYIRHSFVRDSICYSIWHIEGNDLSYIAVDSIRDTIPSVAHSIKEDMERQYDLDYPFKRFSIVEAPAQFFCYPHAWSQAQETVQPEMVFVAERGFNLYQLHTKHTIEMYKKYGIRNSNPAELQVSLLRNAMRLFTSPVGNYNYSSSRGTYNISSEENRYFVFPQFFKFRYNIFSTEWNVANRLIELYMQNNAGRYEWGRTMNGISNSEKANILLEQYPFKDLLASEEHMDLINDIVAQKAMELFAPAEMNIGIDAFRDSVHSILKKYTFRNMQLENLLDTLGKMSNTDILSSVKTWNRPLNLPFYNIWQPDVINVKDRGKDYYVIQTVIGNNSAYDGIVHVSYRISGEDEHNPKIKRKIMIPAMRDLQVTSVWEGRPEIMTVNTMISNNLPRTMSIPLNPFIRSENRKLSEKDEDILLPENYSGLNPDEVIVDNEDSTLFSLSQKPVIGLLPKMLDNIEKTTFKYSGLQYWNAPLEWTATTSETYYGKHILSACAVRSVTDRGGNQTATWKIPVPSPDQYELYYYMSVPSIIKDSRRWYRDAEYRFKIEYGNEIEEAQINLSKSNDGWIQLGVYQFDSDTVRVTLSNECKFRYVIADAVKIVKRLR